MPNYIIAADGTRFVEETRARRVRNRWIASMISILAFPFILAAITGVVWAIIEGPDSARPVNDSVIELTEGDKISIPSPCILHWDTKAKVHKVRCDG